MDATAILEKLNSLGVSVELDGPDIVCDPGDKIPDDMVPDIQEHKREIIGLLHRRVYNPQFPKGTDPDVEYQELVRQVKENGVVLLWSRTLKDFVAIHDTPADKAKVPPGFVGYSDKEVRILFSEDVSPKVLRRVHEAKRLGTDITGAFKEDSGSLEDLLDSLRKGSVWLREQHTALYETPGTVDLDRYTRGLDKFDRLEATLRLGHDYRGCILGEGKRCPDDSQPTCSACVGFQ